ncbi:MAG: chemotaxis protein CheA, partial [Gammaproteobacteria bacterium]|nr:chemotaxis protein CheA [Gammaproteobacteria bacterium]
NPLVNICHRSEDIFNYLRNGEKELSSSMMDRFLQVLDVLNEQFENIKRFEDPEDAPDELLAALDALNRPGNDEEVEAPAAPAATESPAAVEAAAPVEDGDITDQEFESLLDALDENPKDGAPDTAATDSDIITDDEFDALLDELHGEGKFGEVSQPAEAAATVEAPAATSTSVASSDSDEISEDEFDALLDELHGKGKFSSVGVTADKQPEKAAAPASNPAPAAKVEPVKPASAPAAPVKKPPAKKADAAPQAESTVRVDTSRLDEIMNMVGELVLVRNRLTVLSSSDESENREDRAEEIQKAVANLDVVTGDLQTSVMKTRMQPIKKVFGRFPRVVRDLARSLKKDVVLEMSGEETDLDKNLVEALADPLVHLVRNAVDHGVEMPDVREASGKPRRGIVKLAAAQEGDHILLTIDDDGAGMNADKLRGVAVKKGLMDDEAAERLSDKECFMLIFAAGFSTKEEVSDISGRGVGMDVVKTRIASLNGTVDIDSVEGQGTKLSIKVPLTLAIMPTLVIKLMGQSFALPLVSVNEIFHLDLTETNVVDGQRVVMIREKALPLYYLSSWLTQEAGGQGLPEKGHVVVVHVGTQLVGFVVDHLVGQEEVVIKPLGALLQGTQGMAGATITGDGDIALILDIPGILKAYS